MMTVNILDKNLDNVGVIDTYNSLIWVNRYQAAGDCELYLPATMENLDLLKMGYYLKRPDDDMVCQIRKIEIDTDVENGNYLIVTGIDTKAMLDQRVWDGTLINTGTVVYTLTLAANATLCQGEKTTIRKENGEKLLKIGEYAPFTEKINFQRSFFNIGEFWREMCRRYGWGYRFRLDSGRLGFELFNGEDRSQYIIFAPKYENLASTKYVRDRTNMGNAAIIAGAGEGINRRYTRMGNASGIDRFELFIDARDIAQEVTFADVTRLYGGGSIRGDAETGYRYYYPYVDVLIVDSVQLEQLREDYPNGTIVIFDGVEYYRVFDIDIADLPTDTPVSDTPAIWRAIIYDTYLVARGIDKTHNYGDITTFDGEVIPNVTFTYKQDYFLGDIVKVENDYGISAFARIMEVVEVEDENGYRLEPKFEYIMEV